MKRRHISSLLLSYVVPVFVVLTVTPILIESFGAHILDTSSGRCAPQSRLIFYIAAVSGQVFLPLLSSINSGLVVFPVFELTSRSKAIATDCCLHPGNPLKNTLLCLLVASLITSVICFILFVSKKGRLMSKIPLSVIDSLMISTAIFNILVGFRRFYIPDRLGATVVLSVISTVMTSLAIAVLKKTGSPKVLMLYILVLIIIMNIVKQLLRAPEWMFIKKKIFIAETAPPLSVASLISELEGGELKFGALGRNLISILTIALSSVMSFSTTLPFYCKHYGLSVDYNQELGRLGLSNLLSSFSAFPRNVSCTGSILFRICGANTKWHSVVSGLCLIPLYFGYQYVAPLLSTFILALVPKFIGFSILLGYIAPLKSLSLHDAVTLGLMVGLAIVTSVNAAVVLFCGTLFTLWISYSYSKSVGTEKQITFQEIDGNVIAKVSGCLTHINMPCIVERLEKCKGGMVIDLADAVYVDYTANGELRRLVDRAAKAEVPIEILGRPKNINVKLLERIKTMSKSNP